MINRQLVGGGGDAIGLSFYLNIFICAFVCCKSCECNTGQLNFSLDLPI